MVGSSHEALHRIFQMERRPDERKRGSWPYYLAFLRAEFHCEPVLIVVTRRCGTSGDTPSHRRYVNKAVKKAESAHHLVRARRPRHHRRRPVRGSRRMAAGLPWLANR